MGGSTLFNIRLNIDNIDNLYKNMVIFERLYYIKNNQTEPEMNKADLDKLYLLERNRNHLWQNGKKQPSNEDAAMQKILQQKKMILIMKVICLCLDHMNCVHFWKLLILFIIKINI